MKALVIVNGRNCSQYVEECLQSIIDQTTKKYGVCIVDDNSDDDTVRKIKDFCHGKNFGDEGVLMLQNIYHEGTAKCRIDGQKFADEMSMDYDIVIWLDMDDYLLPNAVQIILDHYKQNPETWLTYGNCIAKSTGKLLLDRNKIYFSNRIHDLKSYRYADWKYIHLRTHRKGLIYHLRDSDIGDFEAYPDINMLYCMLEMAGKKHIAVIEQPLYIYRDQHSNTCINQYSYSQRASEKEKAKNITPKKTLDNL